MTRPCLICRQDLHSAQQYYRCESCESPVHRECWIETQERCPTCGGRIPPDPFFLPATPWLNITVALSGGFALVLAMLAVLVLSKIPFGRDAPGTAGIAFYFFFVPIAALGLLFLGLFALTSYLRRKARRPPPEKFSR